jgi:hypothetical protein
MVYHNPIIFYEGPNDNLFLKSVLLPKLNKKYNIKCHPILWTKEKKSKINNYFYDR